jgi:hypothetical protein
VFLNALVAGLAGSAIAAGAVHAAAPARADSNRAGGAVLAAAGEDDLGPTSDPPWNPPAPIPRRRGWERAMLLPGRIVTLPLSGLGRLTESTLLYAENSGWINPGRVVEWPQPPVDHPAVTFVKAVGLGDHSSLGAGATFHTPVFSGRREMHLSARFSGSITRYFDMRLAASGDHADLQYQYDWRPRELFFGLGPNSRLDGESEYSTHGQLVRGGLHWGWNEDPLRFRQRNKFELWGGPREIVTRLGHESTVSNYPALYPEIAANTLDRRFENLTYGASFSSDWRAGEPHWSRGWRVLASAERYDRSPGALELSSGEQGAQFTRYLMEGETGVSFLRDPRTLRLLVRVVDTEVSNGRDYMLVSDLATLGGHEGLGGFDPGRFHDNDLFYTKISYVFPIVHHAEIDLHSEWGNVYHDVWRDMSPATFRHSFGFYLRGRLTTRPWGALGVDFSRERTRFRYTLGAIE